MATILKKEYIEMTEWYSNLDDAIAALQRKTIPHYCNFNGVTLTTDDTIDTAYMKVCGMPKAEFERKASWNHKKNVLRFKFADGLYKIKKLFHLN